MLEGRSTGRRGPALLDFELSESIFRTRLSSSRLLNTKPSPSATANSGSLPRSSVPAIVPFAPLIADDLSFSTVKSKYRGSRQDQTIMCLDSSPSYLSG